MEELVSGNKVALVVGDNRLELEGTEQFIASHIELLYRLASTQARTIDPAEMLETQDEQVARFERRALKPFVSEKLPANMYEALAVVLFYKKKQEQLEEMSIEAIRVALLQAGHRPPQNLRQALSDCRRRTGYVEPGKKRGHWKSSHQGEALVEVELPRVRA
jgi:hypothetical protein